MHEKKEGRGENTYHCTTWCTAFEGWSLLTDSSSWVLSMGKCSGLSQSVWVSEKRHNFKTPQNTPCTFHTHTHTHTNKIFTRLQTMSARSKDWLIENSASPKYKKTTVSVTNQKTNCNDALTIISTLAMNTIVYELQWWLDRLFTPRCYDKNACKELRYFFISYTLYTSITIIRNVLHQLVFNKRVQ